MNVNRTPIRTPTAAGLAGVALLLAACNGAGPAAAADDLSEADRSRIAEEYRNCMAEGGLDAAVDYDNGLDINVSVDDVSDEQAQVTEAACEPILADLERGYELTPEEEARLADISLEVQKCLADAGYVVEVSPQGGVSLNNNDQAAGFDEAEYAEAEEECFRTAAPDLVADLEKGGN